MKRFPEEERILKVTKKSGKGRSLLLGSYVNYLRLSPFLRFVTRHFQESQAVDKFLNSFLFLTVIRLHLGRHVIKLVLFLQPSDHMAAASNLVLVCGTSSFTFQLSLHCLYLHGTENKGL